MDTKAASRRLVVLPNVMGISRLQVAKLMACAVALVATAPVGVVRAQGECPGYEKEKAALKKVKGEDAEKGWNGLIKRCPIKPLPYVRRAEAIRDQGRYCDARDAYRDAIAKCKDMDCNHLVERMEAERQNAQENCRPMPDRLEEGASKEAAFSYAEGLKRYNSKNYKGAVKQFERAKVLAPSSAILKYALASALERAGLYGRAIIEYRAYAKIRPKKEQYTIERLIGYLEGRAEAAWPEITFESQPQEARVVFMEPPLKNVRRTPFTQKLEPRKYTVTFHKDGYESKRRIIDVKAGTPQSIAVTLQLPPKGTNWTRVSAWGAVGLGAATLALGGYFHGAAFDTADAVGEVGPSPREDGRYQSLKDRFEREQLATGVSYGLGIALVGTGVVMLLLDGDSTKRVAVTAEGMAAAWAF